MIAALNGARAGWNLRTVRVSFSPTSSSLYASHKNAKRTRSTPTDGLIQYGTQELYSTKDKVKQYNIYNQSSTKEYKSFFNEKR